MKKTFLTLLLFTGMAAALCSACRGKVTVQSENGTDTIVFNTDSIRHVTINVEVEK